MGYKAAPLAERLWENCIPEPNSGCWLWLGSVKNSGYGQIGVRLSDGRRTMLSAHRAAYIAFVGEIPEGKIVRHSCDLRLCINPDHLLIGDQIDNIADMISRGRQFWGKQEKCKNGHIFSPENTRPREGGGRRCIQCARDGSNRHYRRHINAHPRTNKK